MNRKKIAIVGAGFSGAVLARQLADHTDYDILVFESQDHIGGNCHTEIDPDTRVMVHRYGSHIFHTDNESVWTFLNRFGEMKRTLEKFDLTRDKYTYRYRIKVGPFSFILPTDRMKDVWKFRKRMKNLK